MFKCSSFYTDTLNLSEIFVPKVSADDNKTTKLSYVRFSVAKHRESSGFCVTLYLLRHPVSSFSLAVPNFSFGHGFPHYRCPFCSVYKSITLLYANLYMYVKLSYSFIRFFFTYIWFFFRLVAWPFIFTIVSSLATM